MKRLSQLQELSRDHHRGLVLARKARRAASSTDGATIDRTWAEVADVFEIELSPHFLIEEEFIGTALVARGEEKLVQRLSEEHEELRGLIDPEHPRNRENLNRFGDLLEQHIRFEERELFEVAQGQLSEDELAAVATACHKGSPRDVE